MPDQADPAERDGLDPIQYEDLYTEDDVPLADVRQSGLRVLVYAGFVVTALFVLMGSVVELPRHFTVDFTLKGHRQEHIVQFFNPVYLEETYVSVGRTVEAGEPLVRITSPEIVERIARYETAVERRRIFEEAERRVYETRVLSLELEVDKLEAAIDEYEQKIQTTERTYTERLNKQTYQTRQARERYQREQQLFEKQLTSRDRLEELEEAWFVARSELQTLRQERQEEEETLRARLREARVERDIVRQKLAEEEREMEHRQVLLNSAVTEARETLTRHYGAFTIEDGSLVLEAPFRGTVSYLSTADRKVAAEAILLKLIETPAQTYAAAAMPSRTIGLVDVGDPVVLKVATFPHYEWGVLRGTIRHLSLTPDEAGRYPFEVEITDFGTLGPHLQIGMTGELSVEVEKKSLFGYVFQNLKKGYYELSR